MCNLYSVKTSRKTMMEKFRLSDNRMASWEPLQAIFPGHVAPIIRKGDQNERELVLRSWGFVLLQQGKAPRRVANTRDDKVLGSSFWKESFQKRRCLVPASSFCEPDEGKPAKWHWFALTGEEERPPFAFPGLWRRWTGPVKKDGPNVDIEVFSFMTTLPNALTIGINHERMPVLLTEEEEFETWLSGTPEQAYGLIRSYPPEKMRIVQSGLEKKDLWA